MKTKKIVVLIMAVAIMLANFVPICAMNFDAEETYNSVFVIEAGLSLGSGFAIGENAIITNAHVVSDEKWVTVLTYENDEYEGCVIKVNHELDIVLIAVEGANFTPVKTADIESLKIGDDVFAIGAPNSLAYTLTKGVVSSKSREVDGGVFIQTDAAINTGNSGGPLLDENGNAVGVNSYKLSDSEGIGLAIPMNIVIEYLNEEGIETDDFGVVTNAVTIEEQEEKTENNNETSREIRSLSKIPYWVYIIGIVLSVVIVVSVTIVIISLGGKKNIYIKPDPSERTDFEIEILE